MKKKKKKITQEYILEEIKIANALLEVIDKDMGYNPADIFTQFEGDGSQVEMADKWRELIGKKGKKLNKKERLTYAAIAAGEVNGLEVGGKILINIVED